MMSTILNIGSCTGMLDGIEKTIGIVERIRSLDKDAENAIAERDKAFKAFEDQRKGVVVLERVFRGYADARMKFDEYCKERKRVEEEHQKWEKRVEDFNTDGVREFCGIVSDVRNPGEEPMRPDDLEVVEEPMPPTAEQRSEFEKRIEALVPFAEAVVDCVRRVAEIRDLRKSLIGDEAEVLEESCQGVRVLKSSIDSVKKMRAAEVEKAKREIEQIKKADEENKSRLRQLAKIVGIK